MLRILGFHSSRSTGILWALEEAGADYHYRQIDRNDRQHDEELKQFSPLGKVPVLIDDDNAMSETIAILGYIAHLFPESKLVPPESDPMHWQYLSLASFSISELEQPIWLKAKHNFVIPETLRVDGLNPFIEWEFKRNCEVLANRLGTQEFILGDGFSAADILIAQTLTWSKLARLKIEPENLNNYLKKVVARPARDRAREREQVASAG